jgi:transcription termination factor Rho
MNKLEGLSIYELRNLARGLGIPRPTTMRRDELITSIRRQIESGESPKTNQTRGRPPREFSLDISKIMETDDSFMVSVFGADEPAARVNSPMQSGQNTRLVSGFVHILQTGNATLIGSDLNGYKISSRIISSYGIIMGDYIEAKAIYNDARSMFFVEEIQAINGAAATSGSGRTAVDVHFDCMAGVRPTHSMKLGEYDIKMGQRIMLLSPKTYDRIESIKNFALSMKDVKDICTVTLLVEETDDSLQYLIGEGFTHVYLSKVNYNIKKQFMSCIFALFTAKQLAEQGKNVVLFIDSLNKLFKTYNNSTFTDARVNLHQVNLPSVADLKAYFLSARQLARGGSLTIVTYANTPQSDMEHYIYNEFADLANIVITSKE